jgi:hypothetical protein
MYYGANVGEGVWSERRYEPVGAVSPNQSVSRFTSPRINFCTVGANVVWSPAVRVVAGLVESIPTTTAVGSIKIV